MSKPLASPICYRPDVEKPAEDEAATIASLNESFDHILETTAEDYGHAVRSVHAKAHGIIVGELTVDDALPADLAQGLFATPATHPVVMRFSTNPGDILDDAIAVPRGLAIKVEDVDGERLAGAEGRTQDFLMVNGPVFQVKTAAAFARNLKLLAATTDRLEGTKKVLSTVLRGVNAALGTIGMESTALGSLGGVPNVHPLGETYYSVTPFRYGDYIAKFSLVPVSPDLIAHQGKTIDARGESNAIRHHVEQDMKTIEATWEFRVQLCRDLDAMPIEDPTVRWDEELSPFIRVGTIKSRPQDSWDDERVETVNDHRRFSVWTGLAAHQPLGGINRARRETYQHSADFRERVNGCPIHEPA